MNAPLSPALSAARVRVRGRVQGVGFRPYVWKLARELGLAGHVLNDGQGVEVVLQGEAGAIARFLERLPREAPRLARIESVESSAAAATPALHGFVIAQSQHGKVSTGITPDAATCPECLAELFDPANRRWRYPFINCTHCGPRYTITAHLPYDRPQTSMAVFAQCPTCQSEYDSPADRRFHAQPNACPVCGPRLALWSAAGETIATEDVVGAALARIQAGEILAIKGLGGFHLVCDARNAQAVSTLRARKHRDEKPLALMVANRASASRWVHLDAAAGAALESVERPIVLAPKRSGVDARLPGVAEGMPELGLMLPYTPLHALLFHEAAGRPAGTDWLAEAQDLVLVMTSANPGGEPLVTGNGEAVERLGGIADALVVHDREILIRCDDSVVRPAPDGPRFLRRARGFTPAAIRLPAEGPAVLALGAWLKNTACLTRGREAFLSQHIGDLENASSCLALDAAVEHLQGVLEVRPERIAHDLHPDFYSTRLALRLANALGIAAIGVQHHHAHIAAVLAEHGHDFERDGPALGLAADGVGLGADGAAWGGELLQLDGARFERLGHLSPLRLPGGDRAAREPWRVAASVLHDLGRADEITRRFAAPAAATVATMLERGLNSPSTTSLGRAFDAAAALLGLKLVQGFEGQAPMYLEALARAHGPVPPFENGWRIEAGILSLAPLWRRLADERDPAHGAAQFHATLIEALADWVLAAQRITGIKVIAAGGGCLMNQILAEGLSRRLSEAGNRVLLARAAPPNDGGIALGQAWVAAQTLL